ncbi:MAG: hypothetical protein P8N72_13200 [Flavimaricola sp.]|nr:hypothetical protein [Flavimaricola sp.]
MRIGLGLGLGHAGLRRMTGTSWPWMPDDFGGLTAWFDAEFGVTQSGGVVSGWVDRVAGLVANPPAPINRPGYDGAARNGRAGLVLDGSAHFLQVPTPTLPTANATVLVSAYLEASVGNGSWKRPFACGSGDNSASLNIVRKGFSPRGVAEYSLGSSPKDWIGFDRCAIVTKAGTAGSFFVDGGAATSGAFAPEWQVTAAYIGRGIAFQDHWSGVIQQIVIYDRALSGEERQRLEGWESWYTGKGGANLPLDHPFKAVAPWTTL